MHVDTAGAAAEIAERGDPTQAAIASALAGKIYGLKSLKANIEDAEHNTTRFVVLSKKPERRAGTGLLVTSFVFRVRNIPAALYKALGGFASNGVNMTKLESYMLGGNFHATHGLGAHDCLLICVGITAGSGRCLEKLRQKTSLVKERDIHME